MSVEPTLGLWPLIVRGREGHDRFVTNVRGQTESGTAAGAAIPTGIVVGIDGSPGSIRALRWAAHRADQFGLIQPVVAWHFPWWAVPVRVEEATERARDEAEQALATVDGERRQSLSVIEGPAGPSLVDVGRSASLIAVGSRGRGAAADAVLGSVSSHVVRHATVPVVVVPETAPLEDQYHRVVVGVDGSANSVAALAWAIRHTPAGSTLEAVLAWSYHLSAYPEAVRMSIELFEEQANESLDRTLAAATEAAGGTQREIIRRLEYGDPRLVLLHASAEADLLVLGARGHEGVAHLLVGSVTTSLVHNPLVTTVVVPVASA